MMNLKKMVKENLIIQLLMGVLEEYTETIYYNCSYNLQRSPFILI